MKKSRVVLSLLLTFLKIGAFTFGGGYAMIALLEAEFVTKRGWLDRDEFLDIVAIAESTPGPIAINCATYIGYKNAGLIGSAAATVGVVLPSFAIIYLISLFFDAFLSLTYVFSKHIRQTNFVLLFSSPSARGSPRAPSRAIFHSHSSWITSHTS